MSKTIKEMCQEQNITASKLSKELNISHTTAKYWIMGARIPNAKRITALLSLLNCNFSDLDLKKQKVHKNNIAKLREKSKMTTKDVAQAINVSEASIRSWESGQSLPSSDKINTLIDVLKCKYEDLGI